MTIGIIGAMDEEVELLKESITNKNEQTVANCLFVTGLLGGKEVVLLKSGIGKVNAAMATTILHERFHPTYIINTGSAGGFAEELEIGDIVVSSHVTHHDVDVTAFNYAYGQVPGMPAMFAADSKLVSIALNVANSLSVTAKEGIIATADTFMSDLNHVKRIKEIFPSMIAAEMEAAAVAQVSYQYNTPFVVIRALSDIAGKESSVSFDAFIDKAAKNAATLIMKMIKEL
ncbi:5'-methylthioadenosine/S-adenosylhomocysteine nucleosidase [Virgibacillus sp. DJP39]|uniref:5'-methylthioadenosine/S-adenosylhomocysteine nucleosidase n=1 Tax=Virgibacillus sp. DJP39 TaxID=3409790 RepID=UPI003BB5F451